MQALEGCCLWKTLWESRRNSCDFIKSPRRHLDLSVSQIRGINFPHSHTHVCMLSCFSRVRLFATLWTVAHQAPLSMGFSRQEYLSGLPSPSLGGLPDPGMEPSSPASLALQAESLLLGHGGSLHTHIHPFRNSHSPFHMTLPCSFSPQSLRISVRKTGVCLLHTLLIL